MGLLTNYKLLLLKVIFLPYSYLWTFLHNKWCRIDLKCKCNPESLQWSLTKFLTMDRELQMCDVSHMMFRMSCVKFEQSESFSQRGALSKWSVFHSACTPYWDTDWLMLLFSPLGDQGGEKKRKKGASFQTVSSLHKVCYLSAPGGLS